MHRRRRVSLYIVVFLLLAVVVYGGEASDLIDPLIPVYVSIAVLLAVTVFLFIHQGQLDERSKKVLFALVCVPVLLSTLYLGGHTIYENTISETKGPVHWHADYQVWVCDERADLVNPVFPSNKIGTPLFHEHDDDRIHIEGTVQKLASIDLGRYFAAIGGSLMESTLVYPGVDQLYEVRDGDVCGGVESSLAVYVNGKRIDAYTDYLVYPDSNVPDGDCIIVSFSSSNQDTTSRLCESWQAEGWSYDAYTRKPQVIGEMVWQ